MKELFESEELVLKSDSLPRDIYAPWDYSAGIKACVPIDVEESS